MKVDALSKALQPMLKTSSRSRWTAEVKQNAESRIYFDASDYKVSYDLDWLGQNGRIEFPIE